MTARIRTLSRVLLILALVVVFLVWRDNELAHPFAHRTITRMTADLVNERGDPEIVGLLVPPEHIPQILQSLEPVERAQFVAFWQVLGRLHCVCKNGEVLTVDFYQTHGGIGAFSVWSSGWTGERKRYYRSGTDEGIKDAIRDAYEATKHQAR